MSSVCAGYLEYASVGRLGFVLPVFEAAKGIFSIQVELQEGGFEQKNIDITEDQLLGSPVEFEHHLEETKIMGFRETGGVIRIGSLTELRPVFDRFLQEHADETAVHLQIAELIGSSRDRQVARTRMTELIRQDSGQMAAAQFRDISLGSVVFWQLLTTNCRSDSALYELGLHRLDVLREFSVSVPRLIPELTWAKLKSLLSVSPDDIIASFKDEIMIPDVADKDPVPTDTIQSMISALNAKHDSFERIAFLFRAVLQYPHIGLDLLDSYRDFAQVVTYSAQVLRARLDRRQEYGGSDEAVVASLVPTIHAIGRRRGHNSALLRLAEALHDYPLVNRAITEQSKRRRKKKQPQADLLKILGNADT